jgi:6-phosphogluconate dehydrogenase
MEKLSDIGMIGLAVMGSNLALNMESKGFRVSVYNRTVKGVEEGIVDKFMNGRAKGKNFFGTDDLDKFVKSLQQPRKIMMMVKAGSPVDQLIDQLIPLLDKGDILIDGGNTHFPDTNRRTAYVESKGLLFIGSGVSGGEEGALNGPSLMPGGSKTAWPAIKPIFQSIAAKVADGTPCCDWVGENGAGHFVKMVHNGIEYGDMQLICEAYHIMKSIAGLTEDDMHKVFAEWNKGDLDSYLIEITRDILAFKDEDGASIVGKILDKAGQKGTGKWTVTTALDFGSPLTLIGEAVFARMLSSMKDDRVNASALYPKAKNSATVDRNTFIDDISKALYASKIVSYAQGYELMRAAAREFGWQLNYGGIAMMWRGGCIIRSAFLGKIKEAFDKSASLNNLLLDPYFRGKMESSVASWRRVIAAAVNHGIPVPSMSSALAYFDGYTSAWLPANLLQAQRDYFGAHLYERIDKPRGEFFHTNWTGHGGDAVSTAYQA